MTGAQYARFANGFKSDPISCRFACFPRSCRPTPASASTSSSPGQLKHELVFSTSRSGVSKLGERDVAFRVIGSGGKYDFPTNAIWIDTNGDGKGFDPRDDVEIFRVRERQVNIDDHGWHGDPGRSASLPASTRSHA